MEPTATSRPKGLRLHDIVGLVIGYAMAALLARSFWPRSRPLQGIPAVALAFEFAWLGLAMSGPIVLLLDRRGGSPLPTVPPKRPLRPGQLISNVPSTEPPIGRSAARTVSEPPARFTRAELAWMLIGGYWIGLTMFVVPALSIDTPWALVGLLQVVAALGLWLVVPRRAGSDRTVQAWTHPTAIGLLATWPVAWIFLILLGQSF